VALPFKGTHRIASVVAVLHLLGVLLTAWFVSIESRSSGQAELVWVIWAILDLPVSFLAYLLTDFGIASIHAVLGSIWWYFLAMVVTRVMQTIKSNYRSRSG
jgi:hypothetical protein